MARVALAPQQGPPRDRYGRIARWLGTATDIDDQKRAAEG
jgi:hypothetical protein